MCLRINVYEIKPMYCSLESLLGLILESFFVLLIVTKGIENEFLRFFQRATRCLLLFLFTVLNLKRELVLARDFHYRK